MCFYLYAVKCQGLSDRKYAVLHQHRNAGAKSSKTLWEKGRKENTAPYKDSQDHDFTTRCCCCATYVSAVDSQASELRRELLALASRIRYYDTLPNEIVTIKQGDDVILYQGKSVHQSLLLVAPAQAELPTKGTIHTHATPVML